MTTKQFIIQLNTHLYRQSNDQTCEENTTIYTSPKTCTNSHINCINQTINNVHKCYLNKKTKKQRKLKTKKPRNLHTNKHLNTQKTHAPINHIQTNKQTTQQN